MPNFPIIDSHVHLYDIERLSYGWLAHVPRINRTYALEDFDRESSPVDIDGLIFAEVAVDPGLHLKEAAMIQEMADRDSRLCGIIAHAPLERGVAVEADLLALMENRSVCGIRRLIETERDPSFCLAPDFLAALRLLPKHGLPFDICVKHWALTFAIELVQRCPEVSFVLDHIGKPGIKHGLTEPWWRQMRELAQCPNVVVKVSGVISEADHDAWKAEDVKPYVAHVIDCFGFERVMYGSDWTVSNLTHGYSAWVEILDELIEGASDADKRKFYRETALKTYDVEPG